MKQLIWSWNVNGLRAVMNKDFIATIKASGADIIGLQETKLQEHQIPPEMAELSEYHQYWSHAERKGYSGTCLLSKIEPLKVEYGLGVPEFDNEGRIIIAEFQKFIIFAIYFPNGAQSDERLDYKLRFYARFLEVMEAKRATGKMVLVSGDVNTAHHPIDLSNPKENEKISGFLPIERAWMDKIVSLGWVDSFRHFNQNPEEYTWWSYRTAARNRNVGWRIDYFFINREELPRLISAGIRQDVLGSDHCPVFVEVNV